MTLPWGYFVRESLRQAWRQRLLTLVAVAALALAALYGGAWALLLRNADEWKHSLGAAEQLVVYLRPGLTPQEQVAAQQAAQAVSGVASVDLVTPEQAAADLSQDPAVKSALGLLQENPLPPALKVRLEVSTSEDAASAADRLKALDGVDAVDEGEGAVENFLKVSGVARSVLLALMMLFSATALLIVAAVLRLAAWSRREELGIMRLVGAGHGFIRAPFLFEGLFQGLLAGLLAALVLAGLQAWLGATLSNSLGIDLAAFLPAGMDACLGACMVLATGILGLLGAAIALATVKVAYEGEEAW
ncbi:MAG TPA: permease-like cell division protein FtsX [bacterium]|jgi:cell division transport system permease protein|nr:permease-like cell division protein FtsX [bacterium]